MKLICDVAYGPHVVTTGIVACVDWSDPRAQDTHQFSVAAVPAHYTPGQFYLRELPHLIHALTRMNGAFSGVMVDGYVWLDDAGRKGLGAHLFDHLSGEVPVIGVAKTPFKGAEHCEHVLRGRSQRPLYVTAAGVTNAQAARLVRAMYGRHRVPELIKQADGLARQGQRIGCGDTTIR